jgi:hypothetical protein
MLSDICVYGKPFFALGVGPQQATVIINKQTKIGLLLDLKHPFLRSKWGFQENTSESDIAGLINPKMR